VMEGERDSLNRRHSFLPGDLFALAGDRGFAGEST
jgi:hypothetical protein